MLDAVDLTSALVRCPSVTPEDGGALGVLTSALSGLGFDCTRLPFGEGDERVENLYARLGDSAPNLVFAGHTDVVPVGDEAAWTVEPFGGEVRDGTLFGRGAVDMKGAIACFVAAVSGYIEENGGLPNGSVSLLITGDEEGPAINGTRRVIDWMTDQGETMDACLVGEPTGVATLGDTMKIGRRGSLTGRLSVLGAQGHAAYPELADNPIPRLVAMLDILINLPLDEGTEHFQPSSLVVSTVDVGNDAANVIPARADAGFGVRFNDLHSSEDIMNWVRARCDSIGGAFELEFEVSGEPFMTEPGPFTEILAGAAEAVTGARPEFTTGGGTSDARFIKDHCPVAELGLVGRTMHKVDEQASVEDLATLTRIYGEILTRYFNG